MGPVIMLCIIVIVLAPAVVGYLDFGGIEIVLVLSAFGALLGTGAVSSVLRKKRMLKDRLKEHEYYREVMRGGTAE